jgi:hypothetical protein
MDVRTLGHGESCESMCVTTLAFDLWPKQGGWKVSGQEGDLRVASHALKSAKSVTEWTLHSKVNTHVRTLLEILGFATAVYNWNSVACDTCNYKFV